MKKLIIFFFIILLPVLTIAQTYTAEKNKKCKYLTFGILQGGGSLLGVDFEMLLTKRLGIQVGAGILAFGGGLNYHFKPTVRSSLISLQFWHQEYLVDVYSQSILGPNFVYRGKKWFTAQIGIGYLIMPWSELPNNYKQQPFVLMYSIGTYLPIK